VDFLDTAGDLQFPAMRRLSITNAQAFLLVYAIDDLDSFTTIKQCFEEIREVKSDYQWEQTWNSANTNE
ncbi:GTP-binding protein Di-Ras2-like protein, partial [Dinothrombium tinctorium]